MEKYVLELNELERPREEGEPAPKRKNLLLINKSDLLTRKQRCVSLTFRSLSTC